MAANRWVDGNYLGEDGKKTTSLSPEGTAEETMMQAAKSIHIVMCSNNYLNLSYYIIEKSTGEKKSLDSDEFYAEPGDVIHIEWKTENPVSSMYELDAFNIYKATPHNYAMTIRIRSTFSECLYQP